MQVDRSSHPDRPFKVEWRADKQSGRGALLREALSDALDLKAKKPVSLRHAAHVLVVTAVTPHLEVVDALLEANPGAATLADAQGRLPLHLAAGTCAPVGAVQRLLEANPAAAAAADSQGRLPLYNAVLAGAPAETVTLLLQANPGAMARFSAPGGATTAGQPDLAQSTPPAEDLLVLLMERGYDASVIRAAIRADPSCVRAWRMHEEEEKVAAAEGARSCSSAAAAEGDIGGGGDEGALSGADGQQRIEEEQKGEAEEEEEEDASAEGNASDDEEAASPDGRQTRASVASGTGAAPADDARPGPAAADAGGCTKGVTKARKQPLLVALSKNYGEEVIQDILDADPLAAQTRGGPDQELPLLVALQEGASAKAVRALAVAYPAAVSATSAAEPWRTALLMAFSVRTGLKKGDRCGAHKRSSHRQTRRALNQCCTPFGKDQAG